ncbi:MAG: methyl-accepting chemotaxis protein [Zetaproteobacteria bacterium]|nr:methyl-accepting chemotaxis protein [Zetaproteobacteria bacterium]
MNSQYHYIASRCDDIGISFCFFGGMMKKTSLILQIAAVSGLIAAFGIFITGWMGYQGQKEQAVNDASSKVYEFNQLYFEMLNTLMITGAMDEREVVKKKVKHMKNILDARVMRSEHVIKQFGPGFDSEHPKDSWDARALAGEEIIEIEEGDSGRVLTVLRPWKPVEDYDGVNCFACHETPKGGVNGAIRISYSLAESDQEIDAAFRHDLMISIVLALLSSVVIFIQMVMRMKKPLEHAQQVATQIAGGRFDFQIKVKKHDEVGGVLLALDKMRKALVQAEEDKVRRAADEERSKKEQAQAIRDAQLKMADDFESNIGTVISALSSSSEEMSISATGMSDVASSLQRRSDEASEGIETGLSSVQATAAATEEMAGTIAEVTQRVHEALTIAEEAVREAEVTNDIVQRLSKVSREIGSVVNTINEIAEQTNLLALNASIEAARAGDAGRGFAVVANEVKDLAQQTASATGEIEQQIQGMLRESDAAVQAIDHITQIIGRIDEHTQTVASAMEQQSAAVSEISEGAQRASYGMSSVQDSIRGVVDSSTETNQMAEQMVAFSHDLAEQVDKQQMAVERFLRGIRQG